MIKLPSILDKNCSQGLLDVVFIDIKTPIQQGLWVGQPDHRTNYWCKILVTRIHEGSDVVSSFLSRTSIHIFLQIDITMAIYLFCLYVCLFVCLAWNFEAWKLT